jgi:hypothetical protein
VEELLQISKDKFKDHLLSNKIDKESLENASIDFKSEFLNILRACEEREDLTKGMKRLGLDAKGEKLTTPQKQSVEKLESPVSKPVIAETSSPSQTTQTKPTTPLSGKAKLEEMKRLKMESDLKKKDTKKKPKDAYV